MNATVINDFSELGFNWALMAPVLVASTRRANRGWILHVLPAGDADCGFAGAASDD